MPFTPSHVAAALPFVRTPLLTAGVVVGTMAPDIPYYVPVPVPRELSHSALGAVTVDPLMALIVVAAWWWLLREPVIDLLPRFVGERIPPLSSTGWRPAGWGWGRTVLVLLISVLLGIATHLIWDSFTHPGWVADHVAVLRVQLGPLLVEKWLQHASTVAGLLAIGVWATRRLRRTPRDPARPTRLTPTQRRAGEVVFGAAGVVAGLVAWIHGIVAGDAPFDPGLVFLVARVGMGVAGAAAILLVILWLIVKPARRARSAS